MKKGEWYACRCCTSTGNCTKDVHDEIINKKKVMVGLKRCKVFDGEIKKCLYYDIENYSVDK